MNDQLSLLDVAPPAPTREPVTEPSSHMPVVNMYRDRVIRGTLTMEGYARELTRHDHGYEGPR